MKIRNLQYFEKLIELKNFSKVADFFDVGQPTISMGIKRLEKDLGHKLIVHNLKHNRIFLTPAGEKLHKNSKVFMKQLNDFEDKVKQEL